MNFNIRTEAEFQEYLGRGYKVGVDRGKWYFKHKRDQFRIAAELRDAHKDLLLRLYDKSQIVDTIEEEPPLLQDNDGGDIKTLPIFPLSPEEFILHASAGRTLESVAVIEELHQIDDADKHELPFRITDKGDNAFHSKSSGGGERMLSLADVTIYFLVDCYHKYQSVEDALAKSQFEEAIIDDKIKRLEASIAEYEGLVMKRTKLNIYSEVQQPMMIMAR